MNSFRIAFCPVRIFLPLLLPCYVFSQSFKGGIVSGITTSQVSGDELAGFNKAGLFLGGAVTRNFAKHWSAQMQLVYMQKGSRKAAHPDQGDYSQYKQKLYYIDVPVFLIYKSPLRWHFNCEAGASFGTLIYYKEEDEYGPLPGRPPYQIFDMSITGGISYPVTDHWICYWRIFNSLLPIRGQVAYVAAAERITGGQYNTVMVLGMEYRFGKESK